MPDEPPPPKGFIVATLDILGALCSVMGRDFEAFLASDKARIIPMVVAACQVGEVEVVPGVPAIDVIVGGVPVATAAAVAVVVADTAAHCAAAAAVVVVVVAVVVVVVVCDVHGAVHAYCRCCRTRHRM